MRRKKEKLAHFLISHSVQLKDHNLRVQLSVKRWIFPSCMYVCVSVQLIFVLGIIIGLGNFSCTELVSLPALRRHHTLLSQSYTTLYHVTSLSTASNDVKMTRWRANRIIYEQWVSSCVGAIRD